MTMTAERPTWQNITTWQPYGACRGQDPETYWPQTYLTRPPEDIKCHRCPVVQECLTWALENEGDADGDGIWGGTTPAQRRSLKRPRTKVRCVSCQSTDILEQAHSELCLSCGVSWPT